jgi:SNF2 family DNA or RNA helicase
METTTQDVLVELNDTVDRIAVYFKYDQIDVDNIKTIRGRRWDPDARHWTVPMDMKSARRLREIFGERMRLGNAMRVWAKEQVKFERNFRSLGNANDAELLNTPKPILDVIAGRPFEHPSIPKNHALRKSRPERSYQRADIRMMSMANVVNANDVGTGKTIEVVGAIYEGLIYPKPILVIAPRRTLVNTWQTEFERFSDYKVWASETPGQRQAYMEHIATDLEGEERNGNVVCLIAEDVRFNKGYDIKDRDILGEVAKHDELHACSDYKGNWYNYKNPTQRDFYQIEWGAIIIDEFHDVGLPNRNSLFSISINKMKAERKWPMSATPIGGKPRRLWPILNYLDPKQYTSEWNWIYEYLEVTEDEVYMKGGRGRKRKVHNVGGIADEEKFNNDHKLRIIRRTKKDALPGLPDAVEIIVPTPMTGKQLKQYQQFDEDHEIVIGKKRLSGSIVLSQYKRLRQMANTTLGWDEKNKPVATSDSCKLPHLAERLNENGVRKVDYEPGARAYIGVLDLGFMWVVHEMLTNMGIENDVLHGGTKDSKPLIDRFNSGGDKPYVIVMTVKTGGTGLNLERAGSAHALDEEWDPDIMHQFFGRGDRGARDTALKCYIYRTPDSIQEYVAEVAANKVLNNNTILDYVKEIEALKRGEAS